MTNAIVMIGPWFAVAGLAAVGLADGCTFTSGWQAGACR